MRTFIFIALTLLSIHIQGQIINSGLVGSWMKIKAIYNSGENLPVDNKLNQSYLRLSFETNGKAYKEINPYDKTYIFDFSTSGNNLKIGFLNYQINYLANDTLILVEEGKNGINASSTKYIFVSEKLYQSNISLTPDMIILSGVDSIFIENKRLIARFNDDISFHEFLKNNMPAAQGLSANGFFMATFVITDNGLIDSIKIHRGLNKSFDNQFIKAVNKSAKLWIPAKLNQRNVSVLHTELYDFIQKGQFTFTGWSLGYETDIKYINYKNGIIAMLRSDYYQAIDCFTKYIETDPKDAEALFQRGMCYFKLNDLNNACIDWKKVKGPKSNMANNFINQFCK